jgi:hypothetical protein
MEGSAKELWLRRVLLVKVAACVLVWGLPALLGPPALLNLFGVAMPDDPVLLRGFGALATALGLAYWYAFKDPVRNVAIVRFGIADNGLGAVTMLVVALTTGLSSWFYWVSLALLVFFCLAFVALVPREGTQPSRP